MIGQQLGRYLVKETIGTGAMSTVYLAIDQQSEQRVALKVLHSHLARSECRERFAREAKVLAKLNNRRCVKILQPLLFDSPHLFTVLEYVEGMSLAQYLRQHGPLPPEAALFLVREILFALNDAHLQSIVHRDLKPENILISKNGEVKVTDFGLAQISGASGLTKPGTVIGSPAFMSPEQILGKKSDLRADIFSLGLIYYNALSAELLFQGNSKKEIYHAILKDDPREKLENLTNLPQQCLAIISRCLEKDRKQRFASAKEMIETVDSYLRQKDLDCYWPALANFFKRGGSRGYNSRQLRGDCLLAKGGELLGSSSKKDRQRALSLLPQGLVLNGYLDDQPSLATGVDRVKKKKTSSRYYLGAIFFVALLVAVIYSKKFGFDNFAEKRVVPLTGQEKSAKKDFESVADNDNQEEPTSALKEIAVDPLPAKQKVAALNEEEKGQSSEKKKIPLVKNGFLSLTSQPWAEVYIDGQYYGETPLAKRLELPSGRHQLELKNEYCQTLKKDIEIKADQQASLSYQLTILSAKVNFSLPALAKLKIDGKQVSWEKGEAKEITHGFHQLRVLLKDGQKLSKRLEFKGGHAYTLALKKSRLQLIDNSLRN